MKEQSLPIVPWIGGKRRLAKHILPLFRPIPAMWSRSAGQLRSIF
jgi:hypothetical protein